MYTLLEIYRHELESLFLLALKGRLKMVRGTGTRAGVKNGRFAIFDPRFYR